MLTSVNLLSDTEENKGKILKSHLTQAQRARVQHGPQVKTPPKSDTTPLQNKTQRPQVEDKMPYLM